MKSAFTTILLIVSFNCAASDLYLIGEYGQSSFASGNSDSGKIAAGYRLADHFAVELGAEDLGKIVFKGAGASDSVSAKATSLVLVGSTIIPNNGYEDHTFSVFYKLGMARVTGNSSGVPGAVPGYTALGAPIWNSSKIGVTYGLGASYQLDTNWFLRLDGDVYKTGVETTGDISVLSAGVGYKF